MTGIKIDGLSKKFRKKNVLDNISVEFKPNKIYGLLGRNGTGKSTLINLIGNQLVCKDGEIKIFGKTVKEDISVLENICIVREKEFFLKDYKVKSIFNMHSKFYKNYDYNLQKKLCRLFEINENILKVVALDGHRISIRKVELMNNYASKKVIVPGKTLIEVSKILSGEVESKANIYFTPNHIVFEFDHKSLYILHKLLNVHGFLLLDA